ncbi:formimidoyltetrahydrofolate cyclodeaminase [Romboutsia maritimum]|uniref:Formimidoyltetrahydrofolate cyclodeaminase n=1 Tax=Romboutsia maritimum TaxID=2020948 RepID=A0A371ISC8_9FIRM|nr:cyclodeaminase/cyclohydrolase family protein [Romboutsia maritimum]RDY23384.1 formimidoyltetrahydrofolate cyclodeaminase [Romboutsia maritimum]
MKLIDMTVSEFGDEVDSNSPAPGGGSVSALSSNIGIGLARMMAHLSFGKKSYEKLDESIRVEFVEKFNKLGDLRQVLKELVDKDTESFNEFMKALKMPKDTPKQIEVRKGAIEDATIFSIEVPFKTAQLSLKALELVDYLIEHGNQNAITDIGVGTLMIYTGLEGAILNVKVNLMSLKNEEMHNHYLDECNNILLKGKKIKDELLNHIHFKLEK